MEQTFTASLKRLEEIVNQLEQPDLELEKGLALLEEGVRLHRFCQEKLGQTQTKINQLLKEPVGEANQAEALTPARETGPTEQSKDPEVSSMGAVAKDPWSKPTPQAKEPDNPSPEPLPSLFEEADDGLPF